MVKGEKKLCPDCGADLSEMEYCPSCRARLWLFGQKKAKKEFKPEAFTKYWSEKREQEREREEEKSKRNE